MVLYFLIGKQFGEGRTVGLEELRMQAIRIYASPKQAACSVWRSGEKASDQYDLYKVDLRQGRVWKLNIPEIRFVRGG